MEEKMDKLTAINVFLSVAETGSFTQTAERLNISKSMISRYIALMEDWLNARLFQRTTRKVVLTELGEQAVVFCRKITESAVEMEREISAQKGELRGVIRVASSVSFGSLHLANSINRFIKQHPKLNVQLQLTDNLVDLISERIDLAIRITHNPDPHLIARKLADCHSLLVASPAYFAEYGTPTTPNDLLQHHQLCHSSMKIWHLTQGERTTEIDLSSKFTTNDSTALLNSVLADNGIAMLPKYMLGDLLASGKILNVLPEWTLPKYSLYALYPSREKLPLAVRQIIDFLVEEFEQKDW